jgi:hypothetical protein
MDSFLYLLRISAAASSISFRRELTLVAYVLIHPPLQQHLKLLSTLSVRQMQKGLMSGGKAQRQEMHRGKYVNSLLDSTQC